MNWEKRDLASSSPLPYLTAIPQLSNYGHAVIFGSTHTGDVTGNGILTTSEAYGIDAKIDDGLPGTGSVMSQKQSSGYAGNCTSSDDPTTAKYALSVGGNSCSLHFKLGFFA